MTTKTDLLTWAEVVISLERQAITLIELIGQDVKSFGGQKPIDALAATAEAIVSDTQAAEEQHGPSEWMQRKRRNAEGWLSGLDSKRRTR